MRKSVTQAEVAPLWVKQSQPEAYASAMRFSGTKLYSYGTVIAQIVKSATGKRVYLLNSTGYSSTSSMHLGLVRSAIPKSAKVISVPGCDRWVGGIFSDHKRIIGALTATAAHLLEESAKARDPKKTKLLKAFRVTQKKIKNYAKLFGIKAVQS